MRRFLAIVGLLLVTTGVAAQNGIVVLANLAGADRGLQLQQHEVRNLFMGGVNERGLEPVALPAGDPVRVRFNILVVGLTESRVQAYWSQLRFSGRSRPPLEMSDTETLLEYIVRTPGVVGYIADDETVPEGLSVIYSVD